MKLIDFDYRGNVIKLYFGDDNENKYHGDDWNDIPYEHNAGEVYKEYVKDIKQYAFSFNYYILTPENDWHYNGNSPFSKDDMKDRKCPCIIIKKIEDEYEWGSEYSEFLGSEQSNVLKIYFNDNLEYINKRIKEFGGICLV